MVHKDYKNQFKICLSSMWNQLQDPTPHLSSYQSSCHHPSRYFLKSFPCEFCHRIFHQPLIIYFLISDLLLLKFTKARHTSRVSEPKIFSLYIVMVSLVASSSSSFVFIQFRRGIFNFFASSDSDVLFIYY